MQDVTLSDIVDAEAAGQKYAASYSTQDSDEAATLCLIPDVYSDRLRLRIAVIEGIKKVKGDNYNRHLLIHQFEQSLKALAHINRIRDIY